MSFPITTDVAANCGQKYLFLICPLLVDATAIGKHSGWPLIYATEEARDAQCQLVPENPVSLRFWSTQRAQAKFAMLVLSLIQC
jgi:hypothetical protein